MLRHLLSTWARHHGLPPQLTCDIVTAADEAMTNVVLHAYPPWIRGRLTLTAEHRGHTVTLEVRDTGRWHFGPRHRRDQLGLRLFRALDPRASIVSGPTGSVVRLTWLWVPHVGCSQWGLT
jgi:anti-sigma regulatory factor (Ser/Thr protein kinase)